MKPVHGITGNRATPRDAIPIVEGKRCPCGIEALRAVGTVECVRSETTLPLCEEDIKQLLHCETILQTGLATFFEVGSALFVIREKRLYRATHPTFESYCRERWGIGRSYTWRVIGAAERLRLLPPPQAGTLRPANEFQMRPFLKLEPAAFPKAWHEVTMRAKDGKVTPSLARAVAYEFLCKHEKKAHGFAKEKQPRWREQPPLGQVLALLEDARKRIEKNESDEALEVLARIEMLLFGSKPGQADNHEA